METKVILIDMTKPQSEKVRSDNKKSRLFMTLTYAEALLNKATGEYYANPLRTVKRNYFQQHNADGTQTSWKADPKALQKLIDNASAIPGQIVTRTVKEFPVVGANGEQQKRNDGSLVYADKYTTVVLGGETEEQVFRAANHEIIAAKAPSVAVATVEELQP